MTTEKSSEKPAANFRVSDPVGLTWGELLREAARSLAQAGIADPMRDGRALLTHALSIPVEQVTLIMPDCPPEREIERFLGLVARRAAREPMAHILGKRAFFGREFIVTADVLDPRPETEHLVERALDAPFRRVLDLGCGSGCILLSLLDERKFATGLGVDISPAALEVSARNARKLGLGQRADFRQSDWFETVDGMFDLIVSNPPYIATAEIDDLPREVREYEPHLALFAGTDGLDAYRAILQDAPRRLLPGGRLIVEIGPTQGEAVCALFESAGLVGCDIGKDLAGRDRVADDQILRVVRRDLTR